MQKGSRLKKIVLFTGYCCNNHCRFCIDADKRGLPERSTEELLREIYLAKASAVDILEIIGGESTIRRDFRLLVSTAKKIGIKEVICATNGRAFANMEYARSIVLSGLDALIFSLHGASASVHDYLTMSKGSFEELIRGIDNMKALGFNKLYGNTTVVHQNLSDLPKIAEIYARYEFTNVEYIFVDPTYGGANSNFYELVPKISEAALYMKQAIDIGVKYGFNQWKVRYVPLCYFSDYLNHISEINEKKLYISEHWAQDFYNSDSVASRAEISRAKTKKCFNCKLFNDCEGIWKVYLEKYGDMEFKPLCKLPMQKTDNKWE